MENLKVEGFLVEQKVGMLSSSKNDKRNTALEFAISRVKENYSNGYIYKCNYDAIVEVKPGCMRKVIRFILRKEKEESIFITYKYAIFEKTPIDNIGCKFIEILPVSAEQELGVFDKKNQHDPYLETGRAAVEEFINSNPKVIPYCDLEVMVKFKPGCFKRVLNNLTGNGHKNKFSFDFYSFNIAQDFRQEGGELKGKLKNIFKF
jgi:hypothetical protein